MQDQEGIIRFQLDWTLGPPPAADLVAILDAWRSVLHRLGMIGQRPDRYGGLGFGNVSMRRLGRQFWISGTQTGRYPQLHAAGYTEVIDFDLDSNRLRALGPLRPSSEALTHAAVYSAAPSIHCVLHVHCPEIWNQAAALNLPITSPSAGNGTVELARQVQAMVATTPETVIAMGGHPDGLISTGPAADRAAIALVRLLAEALRCNGS